MVEAAQAQAAAPAPDPDPAAAEQGEDANALPPGVLMVNLWAPGTRWGLRARLVQALLAAAAIAFMASTDDYHMFTAFRHLVAATTLQCIWCLSLVAVDVYALRIKRSFRTLVAACIGDLVTGTLTFIPASGSAAIIVFIHDKGMCSENQYKSFRAATAMAFLSWVAITLPCLSNLWVAIYQVQVS